MFSVMGNGLRRGKCVASVKALVWVGLALALGTISGSARASGGSGGALDFRGIIVEVDGPTQTVLVNGTVVQSTVDTRYGDDAGNDVNFDFLAFGMNVRVRGDAGVGGAVVATRIDVTLPGAGEDGGGKNLFRGIVEAIDPVSLILTVNGMPIQTTAYTLFIDHDELSILFGAIAVNDVVKVNGTPLADGRILAGAMELEDDLGGERVSFNFATEGLIQSIDLVNESVVINGQTVRKGPLTHVENLLKQKVLFSTLTVGLYVEIKANTQPDGSLLAVEIEEKEGVPENEGELKGVISSVDSIGLNLVVSGQIIHTTLATSYSDNFGGAIAFAALQPAQLVELNGTLNPDGSITAASIRLEDNQLIPGSTGVEALLRGQIESIDTVGGTLVAAGTTVTTDGSTLVINNVREPIAFADLVVGQYIEAEGRLADGGAVLAAKIQREDSAPPAGTEGLILRGSLAVITPGTQSVRVHEFEIHHDGLSEVEDEFGRGKTFGELETGDFVEIETEHETPGLLKSGAGLAPIVLRAKVTKNLDQFFVNPAPILAGQTKSDFDASGCTDLNDFLVLLDNWQKEFRGGVIGLNEFLNLLDSWQTGDFCI